MKPFILAAALALLWFDAAQAQSWPDRPVSVVAPFAAGSTPEIAARIVGEQMGRDLGQPFVVDVRPGASGNLGTAVVARAKPDGYTIGVSIVGPLALNTLLFPSLPYNPATDLTFITELAAQPSVLVATNSLGVTTTQDVLALIKKDAGKITFGSIGNGSLSHLAMEAIAMKSGVKLVHAPYTSSPAVVTALIRNEVQLAVLPAAAVVKQAEAGAIRMIAVTSAKRSSFLPDTPTLGEAGVQGVEADAWIGLIAPAKLDAALTTRILEAARKALAAPSVREALRAQYMEPIGNAPEDFRATVDAELKRWGPVIKANDIHVGQ